MLSVNFSPLLHWNFTFTEVNVLSSRRQKTPRIQMASVICSNLKGYFVAFTTIYVASTTATTCCCHEAEIIFCFAFMTSKYQRIFILGMYMRKSCGKRFCAKRRKQTHTYTHFSKSRHKYSHATNLFLGAMKLRRLSVWVSVSVRNFRIACNCVSCVFAFAY